MNYNLHDMHNSTTNNNYMHNAHQKTNYYDAYDYDIMPMHNAYA